MYNNIINTIITLYYYDNMSLPSDSDFGRQYLESFAFTIEEWQTMIWLVYENLVEGQNKLAFVDLINYYNTHSVGENMYAFKICFKNLMKNCNISENHDIHSLFSINEWSYMINCARILEDELLQETTIGFFSSSPACTGKSTCIQLVRCLFTNKRGIDEVDNVADENMCAKKMNIEVE